ncbi:hypothetical protein D9M68_603220 [compost metagenome]
MSLSLIKAWLNPLFIKTSKKATIINKVPMIPKSLGDNKRASTMPITNSIPYDENLEIEFQNTP